MSKKEDLNFRALEIEDMFLILDLIEALGVEEFIDCFDSEKIKENDTVSIGIDVAFKIGGKIIKNLKKCKQEMYAILSALSEKPIEEISKMNLVLTMKAILKLVKSEDFQDFFTVASQFRKK